MRSTLKYIFCRILIIVFITITSLPLSAQDRYVDQGGSDVGNDCSIPGMPCATIQHAVDKAIDGDTIFINSGTYTESIYINKDLNLIGEGTQSTIIQAHSSPDSAKHRVLTLDKYITDSLAVSIAEIKVQNGNATGKFPDNRGGGIFNKGDLTLTDVVLENNYAEKYGGGLFDIGSADLYNVHFFRNEAGKSGGGMYGDYWEKAIKKCQFIENRVEGIGGGLYLFNIDSVSIDSTDFIGNYALEGGGLGILSSNVNGNELVFENNWAEFTGGGSLFSNSVLNMNYCLYKNNIAYFSHGGGAVYGGSIAILNEVQYEENFSLYGRGGGLFCASDYFSMSNSTVHNNESRHDGGGIYFRLTSKAELQNVTIANNSSFFSGGGIYCSVSDSLLISNSSIYQNDAGQGAGINIMSGLYFSLVNTVVYSNTGIEGGGCYIDCLYNYFYNNTFSDNYVEGNGGAMYIYFDSNDWQTDIKNTIFWDNQADENGHDIYSEDDSDAIVNLSYSNCIISDENINLPDNVLSLGNNIITENPDFKAGIDNYQLSNESPLINQGDPDTNLDNYPVNNDEEKIDLAGNPRIVDEIIDIGAYENQDAGKITSQKLTSVDKNMKVFPNPAIDHINVIIPASFQSSQSFLNIYNSTGRKVISKELSTTPRELRINTGNFHAGTYYLKVHNAEHQVQKKLVVIGSR